MAKIKLKEWLARHPKVLNALFVAGFYFLYSLEWMEEGGGGAYTGP